MNRRRFLAATGALAGTAIAGCLGDDGSDYETLSVGGEAVPLAPTDYVADWYDDGETEVADARSRAQYERVHVAGAVHSPSPDGQASGDPVEEWALDTRIVTYCTCPHGLSARRAASLISEGYARVYALDEGFQEWIDRGLPVEGQEVQAALPAYEVRGRSDPTHAGETVWVREPSAGQRELATIGPDGRYAMTLHFVDLTPDTPLELEAPDYELTAPLRALTDTVVTGPESVA